MLLGSLSLAAPSPAQDRPIDAARSTVSVRVFTSGAFVHTYLIDAPLMDGSLGEPADPHLQIAFDARRMRVSHHPSLTEKDREAMQARMLGRDVLDVDRFNWISYHSLTTEQVVGGWLVHGELNLHGQVRPLTVKVILEKNHYTGSATFRQSDFGIAPLSVMGGMVQIKDDVEIAFEIVPEP